MAIANGSLRSDRNGVSGSRVSGSRACLLALGVVLAACGGRGGRGSKAPAPLGSATLWGYVYKVAGKDTVPAAGALVSTDPASDKVLADSMGYWEIATYVTEAQYRVVAKVDGVSGQTQLIEVTRGKSLKKPAIVLIGVEVTAWPPSAKLEEKAPSIRTGPTKIRGGE